MLLNLYQKGFDLILHNINLIFLVNTFKNIYMSKKHLVHELLTQKNDYHLRL